MIPRITLIFGTLCLLAMTGCVEVEMDTTVKADGSSFRKLVVSMPDSLWGWVNGIGKTEPGDSTESEAMAVDEKQRWKESEYVKKGKRHRIFSKRFPNVDVMSDNMIESIFGGVDRGKDKLSFDMHRSLFTTTYSYSETLRVVLHEGVASELPADTPVKFRASVAMPGEIVEAPGAHQLEKGKAVWMFEISPGDTIIGPVVLSVKSGKKNFWPQALMGAIFLSLLFYLVWEFMGGKNRL